MASPLSSPLASPQASPLSSPLSSPRAVSPSPLPPPQLASGTEDDPIDVDRYEPARRRRAQTPVSLTKAELHIMMEPVLPVLAQIAAGRRPSWRHTAFMSAAARDRRVLQSGTGVMALDAKTLRRYRWRIAFSPARAAGNVDGASDAATSMATALYLVDVLVPEAILRILRRLDATLSLEDAEKLMLM